MRKNFGPKTWIYPMPVFIIGTYNEDNTPNAMNAAWCGTGDTNQVYISLDLSHKTADNIKLHKAFTVSFADVKNLVQADYVGIVSGNKVQDKIAKVGWHALKSEFVNAPIFEELPMTLECSLIDLNEETGILRGEIVNVSVDEKVLKEDSKIDVKKLNPITYDPVNHDYIALGEVVGKAFHDGNKIK